MSRYIFDNTRQVLKIKGLLETNTVLVQLETVMNFKFAIHRSLWITHLWITQIFQSSLNLCPFQKPLGMRVQNSSSSMR